MPEQGQKDPVEFVKLEQAGEMVIGDGLFHGAPPDLSGAGVQVVGQVADDHHLVLVVPEEVDPQAIAPVLAVPFSEMPLQFALFPVVLQEIGVPLHPGGGVGDGPALCQTGVHLLAGVDEALIGALAGAIVVIGGGQQLQALVYQLDVFIGGAFQAPGRPGRRREAAGKSPRGGGMASRRGRCVFDYR